MLWLPDFLCLASLDQVSSSLWNFPPLMPQLLCFLGHHMCMLPLFIKSPSLWYLAPLMLWLLGFLGPDFWVLTLSVNFLSFPGIVLLVLWLFDFDCLTALFLFVKNIFSSSEDFPSELTSEKFVSWLSVWSIRLCVSDDSSVALSSNILCLLLFSGFGIKFCMSVWEGVHASPSAFAPRLWFLHFLSHISFSLSPLSLTLRLFSYFGFLTVDV